MVEGLEFLISGVVFGLAAGIAPGPLLALVFSETLKYGKNEGIKIAVSPLITDLPIVLFVLFILSSLMGYNFVIGMISLFGACYLIYLGFENLRVKIAESEVELTKRDALKRGVIANFLSPHPYLFWLSIGGPTIFKSLRYTHFSNNSFYLRILQSAHWVKNRYCFSCGKIQVLH